MHQLLLQLWFAFGHLSCHPCLLALFSFYHWQPVWLLFLVLSTTDWLRNHHTSQASPVPYEPLKGQLRSSDKNKGHLTSGSIDKLSLVLGLVQLEFSFDQIQWKWHWNTSDTSQGAISYLKFKIIICTQKTCGPPPSEGPWQASAGLRHLRPVMDFENPCPRSETPDTHPRRLLTKHECREREP